MVKYHCDYCSKDISYDLRIKCAVCTDFDLCIECFSVGVEIQLHRNDHAYQVMVFPLSLFNSWFYGNKNELLGPT